MQDTVLDRYAASRVSAADAELVARYLTSGLLTLAAAVGEQGAVLCQICDRPIGAGQPIIFKGAGTAYHPGQCAADIAKWLRAELRKDESAAACSCGSTTVHLFHRPTGFPAPDPISGRTSRCCHCKRMEPSDRTLALFTDGGAEGREFDSHVCGSCMSAD